MVFVCHLVGAELVMQEWGFLGRLCPALPSAHLTMLLTLSLTCCRAELTAWQLRKRSCAGCSSSSVVSYTLIWGCVSSPPCLPVLMTPCFIFPLDRSCDTLQHTKPGWFLKRALQRMHLCEKNYAQYVKRAKLCLEMNPIPVGSCSSYCCKHQVKVMGAALSLVWIPKRNPTNMLPGQLEEQVCYVTCLREDMGGMVLRNTLRSWRRCIVYPRLTLHRVHTCE